jgi:hypothetical protein
MTTDPQCRLARIAQGLSYPRSSCAKCGSVIRAGWSCAEGLTDTLRGALMVKVADLPPDVRNTTALALGCDQFGRVAGVIAYDHGRTIEVRMSPAELRSFAQRLLAATREPGSDG